MTYRPPDVVIADLRARANGLVPIGEAQIMLEAARIIERMTLDLQMAEKDLFRCRMCEDYVHHLDRGLCSPCMREQCGH